MNSSDARSILNKYFLFDFRDLIWALYVFGIGSNTINLLSINRGINRTAAGNLAIYCIMQAVFWFVPVFIFTGGTRYFRFKKKIIQAYTALKSDSFSLEAVNTYGVVRERKSFSQKMLVKFSENPDLYAETSPKAAHLFNIRPSGVLLKKDDVTIFILPEE
ncbi:MAG: hypothetical protein MSH60_03480 [Ruminococcus sp.]|nr:hypothetical protein [Ruminococcus sp.]